MPRTANFTVISDGWSAAKRFDFQLPESLDIGSRLVLGFMLDPDIGGEAEVRFMLNAEAVWRWKFSADDHGAARFFQEVIPAGIARAGANRLELEVVVPSADAVLTSDIVLWWHENL